MVKLTRPVAVCDREITWKEYDSFDRSAHHDAYEKRYLRRLALDEPAFGVNWYEAVSYCRRLSARAGIAEDDQAYAAPSSLDPGQFPADPDPLAEGKPRNWPLKLEKRGFRLPTDAEWEIVCRSGADTAFSFGNDALLFGRYGWFMENSAKWSHAVGQLRPSARGLFDMHGNLYEWCHDWYAAGENDGDEVDPMGAATGMERVFRGGGWDFYAASCRAANRHYDSPAKQDANWLGFRVALTLTPSVSEEP